MKTRLRKLVVARIKRGIPFILIAAWFAMQLAGKWLPTFVVCYKANEKPKIEFFQDGCACSQACVSHTLDGSHECDKKNQSSCRDVPLNPDLGIAAKPHRFSLAGSRNVPGHDFPVDPLPRFRVVQIQKVEVPPPRGARIGDGFCRFFQAGRAGSLFCRFLC